MGDEARIARLERVAVASHTMLTVLIDALVSEHGGFYDRRAAQIFELRDQLVADVEGIQSDLAIAALPGDTNDE